MNIARKLREIERNKGRQKYLGTKDGAILELSAISKYWKAK